MKDLGPVSRYLGVDFYHTPQGNLFLNQQQYTAELPEECKVDSTMIEFVPLLVGHVLEADTATLSIDVSAYYHIVVKLIFLCHTSSYLSYAVGVFSRYMYSSQQAHWNLFIIFFVTSTSPETLVYSTSKVQLFFTDSKTLIT